LEQFHINDDRTPEQMEAMVRAQGYDVIYKDWDRGLN
jgi:2-iminoacetate synthase